MTLTITNTTGDGLNNPLIQVSIERPDSPGGALGIAGQIQVPGDTANPIPVVPVPNPILQPNPNPAGPLAWILQVDPFNGQVTQKISAPGGPAPTVDPASQIPSNQSIAPPQVQIFFDITPVGELAPVYQDVGALTPTE